MRIDLLHFLDQFVLKSGGLSNNARRIDTWKVSIVKTKAAVVGYGVSRNSTVDHRGCHRRERHIEASVEQTCCRLLLCQLLDVHDEARCKLDGVNATRRLR